MVVDVKVRKVIFEAAGARPVIRRICSISYVSRRIQIKTFGMSV
jgi:hypothetical protein